MPLMFSFSVIVLHYPRFCVADSLSPGRRRMFVCLFVCCLLSKSQVAKLHEEAKKRGMANVVTYSAAISACAKERRWREALSLLSEMRRDVSNLAVRKKKMERDANFLCYTTFFKENES